MRKKKEVDLIELETYLENERLKCRKNYDWQEAGKFERWLNAIKKLYEEK